MANRSLNALKHGLSSKQILLPTESAEEYAALRASYFDTLQPTNPVEAELVETLAATRWRLRRLATIEANLFNNYILENAEDFMSDSLLETGPEGKIAWAFKKLSDGNALTLLVRYEGTLTRTYDRTFKQLLALKKAKLQNEVPPIVAGGSEASLPPSKGEPQKKNAPGINPGAHQVGEVEKHDCKNREEPYAMAFTGSPVAAVRNSYC